MKRNSPRANTSVHPSFSLPFSLPLLFFTFFKIGATLYGSGYVLLAFPHDDFIRKLGWLTEQQVLDAVAIGRVTRDLFLQPRHLLVLSWAAYRARGLRRWEFLPSFVFVALSSQFIPRIRSSPITSAILDGINVAALGLMLGVTLQLAQTVLVDPLTIAIAVVTALLLFRFHLNSRWLIAGGAVVGLVTTFVHF